MTILETFSKQPTETLDYDVDFSTWLGTDTLVSQNSTVTPSGELTVSNSAILTGDKIVKTVLTGGTTGKKYKVQVSVTTANGLTKEAEYYIICKAI
jgi:hypothetical protein